MEAPTRPSAHLEEPETCLHRLSREEMGTQPSRLGRPLQSRWLCISLTCSPRTCSKSFCGQTADNLLAEIDAGALTEDALLPETATLSCNDCFLLRPRYWRSLPAEVPTWGSSHSGDYYGCVCLAESQGKEEHRICASKLLFFTDQAGTEQGRAQLGWLLTGEVENNNNPGTQVQNPGLTQRGTRTRT